MYDKGREREKLGSRKGEKDLKIVLLGSEPGG